MWHRRPRRRELFAGGQAACGRRAVNVYRAVSLFSKPARAVAQGVLLVAISAAGASLSAQAPSRVLHGTVRDQTGAVVPGARIVVKGAGFQQSATTGGNGD